MITEMFMENVPSIAVREINASCDCSTNTYLSTHTILLMWLENVLTMKDDHFFPCPWHSSNHLQGHGTISTLIEWVSHLHYAQPQSVVIWGFCVWCTQEMENIIHFFPFSLFQDSWHCPCDAALVEASAV